MSETNTTALDETNETTEETTTDTTTETTETTTEDASKDYWPDDWQEKASKGDESRAKLLARYGSPEAAFDALDAAQQRVRSGELLPVLPEDPTDDEVKAWRLARDLPEDPSGYDLKDFEIGGDDKEIIDSLVKAAHGSNQGQDQVNSSVKWYYEVKAAREEARQDLDGVQLEETIGELNREWGDNYRRNQNLVRGYINRIFPEEVAKNMMGGRYADGRAFFNDPQMMRAFLAAELEVNPAGIKTPAGGGDITANRDDEIAEIKGWMGKPRQSKEGKKYWADPKVQERYRELIADRDGNKEI